MDDALVRAIVTKIDAASKIVLLTHLNPDADTLGAASAMYDILWRKQKKVVLFNAGDEISHNLLAIDYVAKVQKQFPVKCDLAMSFDCGTLKRLGVDALDCDLINIDHHVSNEAYGDLNVIDVDCVSTTEVLYKLCQKASWKISDKAAQSLYTGLVSDSLSFGTDRVTEAVFLMAADLVRLGAKPDKCRDILYEQSSLAKLRLASLMLQTLQLTHDAKVGSIFASLEMFEQTGAKLADTEEALRMVMSMGVIDSCIMLREEAGGYVKASLRSKGLLDMNAVASHFEGGGHIRASGFNVLDTMASVHTKLLEIITKELE